MNQALSWSILFYLLSIPMCRASRDNAEPIELVQDLEVDSYGSPRSDMPNDRPNENVDMQQVYKFIEDKFLSFAALNIRPNFANIFRHMERMARAFVKLSTRVDAMYFQMEEMKIYQQNSTRSNNEASLNSLKMTLDELENKVDNIEKQIHLSSSQGLTNELSHLRQQIFNLETRLSYGNEQTRQSPSEVHTLNMINKMDVKLYNMQRNLTEIMNVQYQNQNLIHNTALSVHNINHKFENTSNKISEFISIQQKHLLNTKDANQHFSNILNQFQVQQNRTEQILQNCKRYPMINNPPMYNQHEKISELLDIVQDLPNLVTDAIDKVEIISDKLQERLETGEQISQQCQRDVSSAIPKLHIIESNSERILNHLQYNSGKIDNTKCDTNQIHSFINKIESALKQVLNEKFPNSLEFFNHNITRIYSLLKEIQQSQSVKDETIIGRSSDSTQLLNLDKSEVQRLILDNQNAIKTQAQMHKVILQKFEDIEASSNITLDKLEFITSFLSYFQVDQSNIADLVDTMMKNVQLLNYNNDEVLNNIKEIRTACTDYSIKNSAYLGQSLADENNKSMSLTLQQIFVIALNELSKIGKINEIHSKHNNTEQTKENTTTFNYDQIIRLFKQKSDMVNSSNFQFPSQTMFQHENYEPIAKNIINSIGNLTVKIDHFLNLYKHVSENLQNLQNRRASLSLDTPNVFPVTERNYDKDLYNITERVQKLYNHTLVSDSAVQKQFEQLTEILLSKIQLLMSQSTELQHIKDILNSLPVNKNDGTDTSGITSGITNELKEGIKEKFSDLQLYVQKAVDDALLGIVDVLGKNKLWFQQETSTFIEQQQESIAKLKTSTSTLVSKGFENLQFMYQYLSGKLDKIHQITAHNLEDCADIQKSGHTVSGVYTIYPRNSKEIRVYCDMESNGIGWTVIQRRGNFGKAQRTSFNQSWINYKYGFGNLEEEFWLGNENIRTISNQGNYVLRINFIYMQPDKMMPRYKRKFWHDLKNTSKLYAQYAHFQMNDESSNYSINYSAYTGIHPYDGFEGRTGLSFTTYDHFITSHDHYCAKVQGGGWWYGTECFRFALNSKYKNHYWDDGNLFTGITWGGPADVALLKEVEMKLLPHSIFQRIIGEESRPFSV